MEKKSNYSFTIFTPCYNSSAFIERVFSSLNNQTYRNFDWYVINDASTDNTHELIEEYIKTVDFPVTYYNLKVNQGLHNNINQAIKDANGEFWIIYGHDDEILPNALETFNFLLNKYDNPEIASIYALAEDQNGKLVGKRYPKDEFVSDYWTQFFALNNEVEKFQCWRTSYLREFFPLNTDKLKGYPSAWLWGKVGGKYKSIFINKVLRIYYTNVSTSMTNTLKRDHNPIKIFNYYRCWVNEFQYYIKGNYKRRLRGIGGYVSYGLLAGLGLNEILRPIKKTFNKTLILILFPLAKIYNLVK